MSWIRVLRGPEVVYRARHRRPLVALTFDDGPGPCTPAIAGALERRGCHGTFFLLGPAVERQPEIVAALAHAGHELGNHLWSHENPETLSRAEIRDELARTSTAVARAAGIRPVLVRPPYCAAPRAVARAAARTGTTAVVLRNMDPADWRSQQSGEIVAAVLAAVGPGDIVCLHDGVSAQNRGTPTRQATAAAVEDLVPALLDRGLRPVTVSELLT